MPTITHLMCAEKIIRDSETNTISLITLFDQINTMSIPLFMHNLSIIIIATKIAGEPSTGKLKLIGTINDKELFNVPVEYNFQDKEKTNCIVNFNGVMIPEPGTVTISALSVDGADALASYSIIVAFISPKVTYKAS